MKNKKRVRDKFLLLLAMMLAVGGTAAIIGSFAAQTMEERADMAEYDQLAVQANQPAAGDTVLIETEEIVGTACPPVKEDEHGEEAEEQETARPDRMIASEEQLTEEVPLTDKTAEPRNSQEEPTCVDLAACKAQNGDFVAWLRVPGTGIDYPVVWSDDAEYYLHHTFTGKESSVGTLFSLCKTDYAAPSRNIAIYGHHLRTDNMFTPLLSYKKRSFWAEHDTVTLDSLYHSGTYRIFAALNMNIQDWEPSTADFPNDEAFMAFVERAREQAFYDTGVHVEASDEILTLITCDRGYAGADGRMLVMAVKQ